MYQITKRKIDPFILLILFLDELEYFCKMLWGEKCTRKKNSFFTELSKKVSKISKGGQMHQNA